MNKILFFFFNILLYLIISDSLCVKSSSILCEFPCFTDGLTAGGGTGNIEHINHSGRHHIELNPNKFQSSSDIFSNNDLTYSAVKY